MAANLSKPSPVTEHEVCRIVKEALLTAFGGRPVETDVVRRGLVLAASDLIQLRLCEVAAQATR